MAKLPRGLFPVEQFPRPLVKSRNYLRSSRPLPGLHIFPYCYEFLNRPRGRGIVDELAAPIRSMIEALNGAFAHRLKLAAEFPKLLWSERLIRFRAAGHLRLVFAILSRKLGRSYALAGLRVTAQPG